MQSMCVTIYLYFGRKQGRLCFWIKTYDIPYFLGRTWPIAFGVGTGFGMGYSNAENDFQNKNAGLLKRLQVDIHLHNK